MSDSLLFQKYVVGHKEMEPTEVAAESGPDAADDLGAFGWMRGVRERAMMLELRKRDGNILAVGYGWLERAEYDPSSCITLHLVDQKIRIKGCNLNAEVRPLVRLFQGIIRHRVPWIQEADQASRLQARGQATVIEAIEW